ncbi:unnamed protein product [Orchesella dallaii]|uniref:Uncharacterized protein n=1 Tax=Orchesella dallaii TaxID=48710 RepID=A0ABP1QNH9_9HEXA
MENIQVEPEIFSQGEATVLSFPFLQDPKFFVDQVPPSQRQQHKGEAFMLKLNANFNSGVTFQASESSERPFKLDAWNREEEELVLGGLERDVARRVVLRKRFPLYVEVSDGVIYSPSLKVVCESLSKIQLMSQQKIPKQVFVSPQVTRNAEIAREAVSGVFANTSQQDLMMNAGFGSMHSQGKPLTRIPLSTSLDEPVAGPSRQSVPLKKRKIDTQTTPSTSTSHADVLQAIDAIQSFFNPTLMDTFNIPGDRAARNIEDKGIEKGSLEYSFKQFHTKTGQRETNTTKMGFYSFGEGRKNCNLYIYKTRNKFTGHNVPFSIREGASLLKSIILTMIEAMVMVARNTLEKEKSDAANLEGADKQQAILAAEQRFAEKMARLGHDE